MKRLIAFLMTSALLLPLPALAAYADEQTLTASDGEAVDVFGDALAISSDGTRMVVGARLEDTGANSNNGAIYVYVRSGTVWTEEQKLAASNIAGGDQFGYSVAINADGSRIIAGGPTHNVGASSDQGSAYVFSRSGTVWTEEQVLTASNGTSRDQFGISVDMSADGSRLIVGTLDDAIPGFQGYAYVFSRSGTVWTEEQILAASDGAIGDQFGMFVSMSDDSTRVVVGAQGDDVGVNANQGSAYVFSRSGTVWSQEQKLTASDAAASDIFGRSVSMNSDGSRFVVGAVGDDVGANANQGSAYVFSRSGTVWSEEQKLTASDGAASDQLGFSGIAMNSDGDRIIAGVKNDDVGANANQGSAYVFSRSDTVWTEDEQLTVPDGAADDTFGVSADMDSDGTRIAVGASFDDVGVNANQGSVYVYAFSVPTSPSRRTGSVMPGSRLWYSLGFGTRPTPTATPSPVPSAPPVPSAYVCVPAMFYGNRSEEVRGLQMILKSLGFFPADVDATGFFGTVTENAARAFQASRGIPAIGIVGPLTCRAINAR